VNFYVEPVHCLQTASKQYDIHQMMEGGGYEIRYLIIVIYGNPYSCPKQKDRCAGSLPKGIK